MNKQINVLPCLLLFLAILSGGGLFGPAQAFASGQAEEDKLSIARRLIDEKRYDEANTLLAEIIKSEPQKFEKAQKLAQEILNAQRTFNSVYEDLIHAIDRGDVDKALANIKLLNELDPDPNETVAMALDEAQYSAELAVNLKTFNEIMTTALAQLNQAQYLAALETYLSGFELHKEDFANSGFGNIVLDTVTRALARLLTSVELFKQKGAAYTEQLSVMEQDIQAMNLGTYLTAQSRYLEDYLALKQLAAALDEPSAVIKSQYEKLKAIEQQTDDPAREKKQKSGLFYLFYLDKLVSGRREMAQREGIQNTIHLLADESLRYLEDRLSTKAQALRLERNQAYQRSDLTATHAHNQHSRLLYQALMQLSYLFAFDQVRKPEFEIKTEQELILKDGFPQLTAYQERLKETATFAVLIDLPGQRLAGEQAGPAGGQLTSLPTRAESAAFARATGLRTTKLATLILEWLGWQTKLTNLNSPAAADADEMLVLLVTEVAASLKNFHSSTRALMDLIARRLAEETRLLVHGEVISVSSSEAGVQERQVKYPHKRVENLQAFKQHLLSLMTSLAQLSQPWATTEATRSAERSPSAPALPPAFLLSGPGSRLTAALEQATALTEQGNRLLREIDDQLSLATQEMLEAERYQKEGQKHYNASQTAFRQRDYARARSNLESASIVFDKALEKQEDEEIRYLRDKVFPEFIVKINQAENERVVGEVRSLLEQGIQTYRENRFEEAEILLVKAQTRWQDTNKNMNEEIEAWLSVVQRAQNLRKGWEITEVEPLYPEITQRLNLAIDDYNKGLELVKSDNSEAAHLHLERALEKLDNIKISYPLLKEANILRLKINKEFAPGEFRNEFQKNIRETEQVLANRQTALVQDKYSVLKEYELVLPTDKTLKNLIHELEIFLGIKQRPPSQADITQSKARVQPAQDIYNKRQRDLYPRAIELLNEAIRIWPDNKEAKQLKDRIQIARGEVVQSIITADDQQALIRAEKLYSERNYAESYSITQGLLKKPGNRNYPPLIALNEKNMIRLGLK